MLSKFSKSTQSGKKQKKKTTNIRLACHFCGFAFIHSLLLFPVLNWGVIFPIYINYNVTYSQLSSPLALNSLLVSLHSHSLQLDIILNPKTSEQSNASVPSFDCRSTCIGVLANVMYLAFLESCIELPWESCCDCKTG